jgi:homoserine kinase type II
LYPDNVLIDDRDEWLLLDFEQATHGSLIYDVAVCLTAWCWTGSEIDGSAADAFLAAYTAMRPFDAHERDGLIDAARLAAARFAITRITDVFLPPDVDADLRRRKDYRECVKQLAYWQAQS